MRTLRLLAALVLALGSLLVATTPAQAAGAPVVELTIKAVAGRDGLVTVTQSMTYDFGSSGGHGPYLYWTTKQAIDGDPGHWRIYRYDVRRVTSSTGAPTRVNEESGTDYLAVKIGDPNRTVTGRQSYEIVYTVQGVVNPNVQGAKVSGAKHIIAVDPNEFKQQIAPSFGATHTAPDPAAALDLVKELTWGVMADRVILTPGVVPPDLIMTALMLLRKGGTCVLNAERRALR